MAKNSVIGCFRDIEIAFSIDIDCIRMNMRNLVADEKEVRLMYQKQPTSGLANWRQFRLTHKSVTCRLPTEVLEAYRLTFFVDAAEPISARVENILKELAALSPEPPAEDLTEDVETGTDMQPIETRSRTEPSRDGAAEHAETTPYLPERQPPTRPPRNANSDAPPEASVVENTTEIEPLVDASERGDRTGSHGTENTDVAAATEQVASIPDSVDRQRSEPTGGERPDSEEEIDEPSVPSDNVEAPSAIRKVRPESLSGGSYLEFKVSVPTLPPSMRADQQKAQLKVLQEGTEARTQRQSKQKGAGLFGQLVRTLTGGKRGKAYYQEKGETIQNEFQDQLAKLERDYNEGYGLDLSGWKPEALCEEETAIFLLNLMANEIAAWQKETGRARLETEGLVETLAEIDVLLRQTLKQTRGISSLSPTLFPNLLAENERDLEKIQNECDAYLRRFSSKLTEQEKQHAKKIEIVSFRKFLTEFVRDFLFPAITKLTQGHAMPKRLNWFLDLVDSEVMPIEVGKTEVLSSHHKVKGARPSECEPGTIVEVITPGLQSKDGKRVNQMAVVIEAE